jgi:ABC-type multidrug transport system fused ATPase/permease subunit
MISDLKKIFSILTRDEKKNFLVLQIFMAINAFAEIASIYSIVLLVGYLTSDGNMPDIMMHIINFFNNFNIFKNDTITYSFVVILVLIISSIITIITNWKASNFASYTGYNLSTRLFEKYNQKNWYFFLENNSSNLINKLINETSRITTSILEPILMINSKIIFVIPMIFFMIKYNFIITFSILSIFFIIYFLVYRLIQKKILLMGYDFTNLNSKRIKFFQESIGNMQIIKINNLINFYQNKTRIINVKLAAIKAFQYIATKLPRSLIEFLIFLLSIILLNILISETKNLSELITIFAFYALAGLKLMPSCSEIYSRFISIKGALPALNSVKKDFDNLNLNELKNKKINKKNIFLTNVNEIKFSNVFYKYPGQDNYTLKNINFSLKNNLLYGISGISGSGKSTLINLIIGMIRPTEGKISLNNIDLNNISLEDHLKKISLVPQRVLLTERKIKSNILLGDVSNKTNISKRFNESLKVFNFSNGKERENFINIKVKENGTNLSGGQIQKIGISRAIFKNSDIVIFDEPTSSLDGISEKDIINSINLLKKDRIILIISHDKTILKNCDKILFLNKNELDDFAEYENLIDKNINFEKIFEND